MHMDKNDWRDIGISIPNAAKIFNYLHQEKAQNKSDGEKRKIELWVRIYIFRYI